jgi:hypothetical protein
MILAVAACAGAAPAPTTVPLDDFDGRAAHILSSARETPLSRLKRDPAGAVTWSVPDPGKHTWNHVLAHLAADRSGATPVPGAQGLTARQLVHELLRYPNVFHFNADGPTACLMRFPEIVEPADRLYFFEGHDRSVLNHSAEANYNLFTGEGTENHVAMSRFAGHLLCQDWLRDHPVDARARDGLALTKQYILQHARDVYRCGTGEWNSSTYYGYQLRGMLTCYQFAADPEVRGACRALLDHFAAEMALKYVGGINAGPETRGNAGHESAVASEMDQIAWLWWGDSPVAPRGATNAVYAALSDYRPPAALAKIARKEVGIGETYFNSNGSYLLDRAAESRESIYLGDGYALSCAYLPYAGFTGACAQFRPNKLVARGDPVSGAEPWLLTLNSNGLTNSGTGRGPWDQWAHHKNVLVQLTRVPSNAASLVAEARAITERWQQDWAASFKRRWPNGSRGEGPHVTFAAPRVEGVISYAVFSAGQTDVVVDEPAQVVFLRHGHVFVAIRSLGAALPIRDNELDPKAKGKVWLTDPVAPGGIGGLVIEVGTTAEHGSFEDFRRSICSRTAFDRSQLANSGILTYTTLAGERLEVRFANAATMPTTEPAFDWGYILDPTVDHPAPLMRMPPFEQPSFPRSGESLEGWGRIPSVTIDGRPVGGADFLDLNRPWPVFVGPHINQTDGVLTLDDGSRGVTYRSAASRPSTSR